MLSMLELSGSDMSQVRERGCPHSLSGVRMMVLSVGLEPTTLGVADRYSVQLSYESSA